MCAVPRRDAYGWLSQAPFLRDARAPLGQAVGVRLCGCNVDLRIQLYKLIVLYSFWRARSCNPNCWAVLNP